MTKGNWYKHKDNKDVCIYVSQFIRTPRYYKVTIKWFNCSNPNNVFDMGLREKAKIKKEHLYNWKYFA